ncbi:MAG: glycosyltransferase family 39 protein [Phycisphaerae bacterium]|nr:glycosyltransferase family 39 protein [Phycisphaerae bacterium]
MSNAGPPKLVEPSIASQLAWIGVVLLPVVAIVQFIAFWRIDVVDDQMFGYFGWRIAHGARPYLDVWDNKPPGIYWINALGYLIGFDSYLGVVALCALALVVAHVAYFFLCETVYFRPASTVATVLLSFYLPHVYFTGGTNRTETFVVAAELVSAALYARGFRNLRWHFFLASGFFAGVAFTFKQVGLACWGAMLLHLALITMTRELPPREALRRAALLIAGLALCIGGDFVLLWVRGGMEGVNAALFATFGFNAAYFANGNSQILDTFTNRYFLRGHYVPIMMMPLWLALGGVLHAIAWWISPETRPFGLAEAIGRKPVPVPKFMVWFALWFLIAMYGAIVSPHAFRHYLVPTIAPLMLMGAFLLNALMAELPLFRALARSGWTAAAFAAIAFFGAEGLRRNWEEASKVYVNRFLLKGPAEPWAPAPWEKLAAVVRHCTSPTDKIQCWGYFPGVYLNARRINTSRFTTTEKVGQLPKRVEFILHELEATLKREPPAAIVISDEDYEWMYGRLKSKPEPDVKLGQWIDANYTRVADISLWIPAYVYKRDDLLRPEDFWEGYRPPPELKQFGPLLPTSAAAGTEQR